MKITYELFQGQFYFCIIKKVTSPMEMKKKWYKKEINVAGMFTNSFVRDILE